MLRRGEQLAGALAFAVASLGSVWKLACDPNGGGLSERAARYGCYTDIVPLYFGRGLIDGVVPYLDAAADGRYLEYPVLTGAFVRLAQLLAGGDVITFTLISWLLGALFAGLAAIALFRLAGATAAFVFALSPLLFFEAGINWDLAPTAFAVLALLAWKRGSGVAAGVFVGLGTAAKLWPALLLPVLLLDALRTRRPRAAFVTVAAAAVSWLVVNAPIALANRDGWWEFYAFSSERPRDWGSVWLALEYLGVGLPPTATLNTVASAVFLVALAAVGHLMWHQRISVGLATLMLVYAFTLVGKVYSPQYSVWLLALTVIVFGASRWVWAWTAVHLLYFFAIWRHLLEVSVQAPGGLTAVPYAWITLAMQGSTAVLVGVQLRRELRGAAASAR